VSTGNIILPSLHTTMDQEQKCSLHSLRHREYKDDIHPCLADVKQKTRESADQNRKIVYPQSCWVTDNLFIIITENVVAETKISSTLTSKPSIGFTQLPSSQNICMKTLQSCLLIFSPQVYEGGLNIKIMYAFLVFHHSYTQVKHRLLDDDILRSNMPVQKNLY
jgi:hypothetical protein